MLQRVVQFHERLLLRMLRMTLEIRCRCSCLTKRYWNQYGQKLCLANLPGDSFRARHDAIAILSPPVLDRKAHCGIISDTRLAGGP